MDEKRLLGRSVQHMGHREMATNLHNNESESSCQSRGQHAYKCVRLLCDPSVQIRKGAKTASDISGGESYSQHMTEKYVGEEE
ncbi:hypothetical protein Taro_006473 [Colocasia esculenta]|uniref:Uncharacterized protein n=1 Tax=Colocasia esculenta TaxID=4460 RepID=A0A843TSR2_COLES|nr:hypothetical protein [Colocasia esculenta]